MENTRLAARLRRLAARAPAARRVHAARTAAYAAAVAARNGTRYAAARRLRAATSAFTYAV